MHISPAIAKREALFRRIVIALGTIALLTCVTRAIIKPDEGDFKLHQETGRRFLAGEFLYAGGHDFPYPPFFGMVFAPTALLPTAIAKAVFVPVGVAALCLLVWTLRRLVASAFSLTPKQSFWTGALAIFLAVQFIIRDQAELGLNTALTALTWLGIYFWRQKRDLLGGVSLGLAIAIKCTPVIFLGYFFWKRQWRMAICAAAAALLLTAAPAVWHGSDWWTYHMKNWIGTAIDGISGSGFEGNEDFRDKNMALRPALTRYLVEQHGFGRVGDPFPLRVLQLPPVVAGGIVNVISLSLGGMFLWWTRHRVNARDDPRFLWELAAAGVLMVLFSPITWTQHGVALLPACYLIAAILVVRDRLPWWILVVVMLYTIFCAMAGRDLIGRDAALWLASYHVSTFCILALLPILLVGPELQETARRVRPHDPA